MSWMQRVSLRLTGIQRLILFIVLFYDLYIYKRMIDEGLIVFVFIAVVCGVSAGCFLASLFRTAPERFRALLNVTAVGVMVVFGLSQFFGMVFPGWVYLLSHVLLCFWFTGIIWYASRPLGVEDYLEYPLETDAADE